MVDSKYWFIPEIFSGLKLESLSFGDLSSLEGKKGFIFTLGKNAIPMAKKLMTLAKNNKIQIDYRPLIVTKSSSQKNLLDFECEILFGYHPIMGNQSFHAGKVVTKRLSKLSKESLLLFGISGGGSSLMELPVDPFSEDDLRVVSEVLLKNGSKIEEVNSMRSEISDLKRGGILKYFPGAFIYNYIASDIPGSDFKSVSSGPSNFKEEDPKKLERLLNDDFPLEQKNKILSYLYSQKRKDYQNKIKNRVLKKEIKNNIIADFNYLKNFVENKFKNKNIYFFDRALNCNFKEGKQWFLKEIKSLKEEQIFFSGGELPVNYSGNGVGGRNTHFTLELGIEIFKKNTLDLSESELKKCVIGSMATDGDDGNTSFAGAIMDWGIFQKGISLGLDLESYVESFESFTFFKNAGGLIENKGSELNLMDLRFFSKNFQLITK